MTRILFTILITLISFESFGDSLNRPDVMWKVSEINGSSKDEFVKLLPADPNLPPKAGRGWVIKKVLIKRFELADFEELKINKIVWYSMSRRDIQAVPLKKWVGLK